MGKRGERRQSIVLAYVTATGGRLPANLGELLSKIREAIPHVRESELADALRWAIRRSKRKEAKLEAAILRGVPTMINAVLMATIVGAIAIDAGAYLAAARAGLQHVPLRPLRDRGRGLHGSTTWGPLCASEIMHSTYRCKSRTEEDFFLARFTAS